MQYIHNNDPWPEGKVTSKNNSEHCTMGVSLYKSHHTITLNNENIEYITH